MLERSFLASLIVLSLSLPGFAKDNGDGLTGQASLKQREVGAPQFLSSDGSFDYSVSFEVPKYHGLEPNLGLSYSSGDRGNGSPRSVLGPGWSLNGLSSILRVSQGDGAASYNDTLDVFQLDGEELVSCSDTTLFSSPYPRSYKASRKSTKSNASCSYGGSAAGNLTTLRESYRRIKLLPTTAGGTVDTLASFVVTDKSGNQYTYTSLGVIATPGSSPGSDLSVARPLYAREFLLTEVRDAQATPNIVSYSYIVDDAAHGWAYRLKSVSYGSYVIDFNYAVLPDSTPLSTWGLGAGTTQIGRQVNQLRSVVVRSGMNIVRGYGLTYSTSNLGRQTLTGIVQYGKDLVLSGNAITSGSALPGYTFSYAADGVNFVQTDYPTARFHTMNTAIDLQGDGRDDALFYKFDRSGVAGAFGLPVKFYTVNPSDRTLQDMTSSLTNIAKVPATSSNVTSTNYTTISNLGILSTYVSVLDGIYTPVPSGKFTLKFTEQGASVPSSYALQTVAATDGTVVSTITIPNNSSTTGCYSTKGFAPLVGNFDPDPSMEVVFANHVYDIGLSGTPSSMKLVEQASWAGDVASYCGQANLDEIGLGKAFEWVVDLDGDGIDEIVNSRFFYRRQGATFVRQSFASSPILGAGASDEITFGDVNGDGLADVVKWSTTDNAGNGSIKVALGTGSNFGPLVDWAPWASGTALPTRSLGAIAPRMMVVDMNGDGLGDVFIHRGFNKDSASGASEQESLSGRLFLSQGNSFYSGSVYIDSFLGVGDYDGDGLMDILSGANGTSSDNKIPQIYFNRYPGAGNNANVMTSVTDPRGKVTTISYGSDTTDADNLQPGSRRVVTKIVESVGSSASDATTQFSYSGGRFNYGHRRSMGYGTVTATLPAIAGETDAPRLVTTYYMSMATAGRIKSQKLYSGPAATNPVLEKFSLTLFDYSYQSEGYPYSATRVREVAGVRYGADMVYSRKDYRENQYGEVTGVLDRGIVSPVPDYDDIAAGPDSDNTVVIFGYSPNLSKYIVNRPASKLIEKDIAVAADPATRFSDEVGRRLYGEFYRYDGASSNAVAPTAGNLTALLRWTDPATDVKRIDEVRVYDGTGNLLESEDAKQVLNINSGSTQYTYDANGLLLSTTNALLQAASATWDPGCQTPLTGTDANNLVTTFTYDAFCREIGRVLPTGVYIRTTYNNFGSSTTQFIKQETRSSSTSTINLAFSSTYFDGSGRTYKTANSGTTATDADAVVQISGFNRRGGLAWKSIPLTWAQGGAPSATASTGQRTSYAYDAQGRVTQATAADGSFQTTAYVTASINAYGTALTYPGVETFNADCNDNVVTTICGNHRVFVDHAGRKIREVDADTTMVPTGVTTNYRYDLLGRMISVADQGGSTWAYTYDTIGNRLTVDDPDLVNVAAGPARHPWILTYDNNNNLLTQTDAANHVITFTYDTLNRVTKKKVQFAAGSTQRLETVYTYDEARTGYYNTGKETTQEVTSFGSTGAASVVQRRERDYLANGNPKFERHAIDGRTYTIQASYNVLGQLADQNLPYIPGSTNRSWVGSFSYDAAGRVVSMGDFISSITYNIWGNPTEISYGNVVDGLLASDVMAYDADRGWLDSVNGYDKNNAKIFRANYVRSAAGRISSRQTSYAIPGGTANWNGDYDFTYDYAGRLLTADRDPNATSSFDQFLTYTGSGLIHSKGSSSATPSIYYYGGTAETTGNRIPDHAPRKVGSQNLDYDLTGNMTIGLGGRSMTYDAENRLTSVTYGANTTCYVYGIDGSRLKKIEIPSAAFNCATTLPASAVTTVYFGPVEIRNYKSATSEQVITYPHPNVKLVNGKLPAQAQYLHRDGQGSVRAITDATGLSIESAFYKPFGEQTETLTANQTAQEAKGYIGERFDAAAGLQYLNARSYDPVLGMFVQPDWFEVAQPGVGTARYTYANNDPINAIDPSGHAAIYKDGKYVGQVNPGDAGYEQITSGYRGPNDPMPSDWVAINKALKGGGRLGGPDGNGLGILPFQLRRTMSFGGKYVGQLQYETISGTSTTTPWTIKWVLTDRRHNGGYIIQHVTAIVPNHPEFNMDFWEAWDVMAGGTGVALSDLQGFDDMFQWQYQGRAMQVNVTATARFYNGLWSLPSSFIENNPNTIAGPLPSTTQDPGLPLDSASNEVLRIWSPMITSGVE